MKKTSINDTLLKLMATPPKSYHYFNIQSKYDILAVVVSFDSKTVSLKTDTGTSLVEKKEDIMLYSD